MKIKLSHYWWNNLYFILGLGVVFEITLSYLLIGSTSEEFKMLVGVMLFYCVCFLDVAFRSWRFLMTMEIKEGAINSFLFGKLKCEVFVDREIFYAIFDCRESLWHTNKYIAISNETFTCETRKATFWSENRFIDYYDCTKQIIFPYNEKTKNLFAIEKWRCVN